MRKWLIGLVALLLLVFLGIYFLLPAQQVVSNYALVGAGQSSVYRCLSDEACLQKWWHDEKEPNTSSTLQQDGYHFHFVPRLGNVVTAEIKDDNTVIQSSIAVLSLQADSSVVEWKASLPQTGNPFKKLQRYFAARKLRTQMAQLMNRFQQFMADDSRVYGMEVKGAKVTDTMVVTTSVMTDHYPKVEDYYSLVEQLKTYIASKGAQETNFPMLNISPVQNRYQARVAIPVSKPIPSSGDITFKRLIPGNILIAEVKGGTHAVDISLQQLENFVSEKGLSAPAIPFQSLVTNRLQQRDTTQWITRLYYPVY
ncbi:MAG: hypothetical protein ACO1NX_06025 [Chitinophagaceae bacterium]